MKRRKVFGVVAATVANIEQREILSGIYAQARAMDIDIVIMSNIYNPAETADVLKTENIIYELIGSDELDGIILISEAVINADVQRVITEQLERKDVPILTLGVEMEGFTKPSYHYVNTCDENDLEDVCDHLIDVHGYTDIHILSGNYNEEVSHRRVEGYRRSLEKHGIAFDESKVFFGDFWLTSGRAHAVKYIEGELPYPQALICCNDYMAYGLLDEYMERNIDITEKMSVISYEYIRERGSHLPLLTTYRRNRSALGVQAVEMLAHKIDCGEYLDPPPPRGQLICGDTCPCGSKIADIKADIQAARFRDTYQDLHTLIQFEHRLMECRSITEFIEQCRDPQFLIMYADKVNLCLYENWYDDSENSDKMVSYDLLSDSEPFMFHKYDISTFFRDEAAHYYFCPLFFSDRELGYVVMGFKGEDTFNQLLRSWLKTISNGLEYLRMKNDISFYLQCQDISEKRDPLTGMLNENGLRRKYRNVEKSGLYFVALKIGMSGGLYRNSTDNNEHIYAVQDAAEAVRQFCGDRLCGKISDDTFVCLIRDIPDTDVLSKQLAALLLHHSTYMKKYGLDSFVCAAVPCGDMEYFNIKENCFAKIAELSERYSQRRAQPHYKKLNELRAMLYKEPQMTFNSQDVYSRFYGSDGYLRAIFRKCYGFTLHDDCINARIAAARYQITMTQLSNAEIAERCGYKDLKYFMRQFQQVSGYTVMQYRKMWS